MVLQSHGTLKSDQSHVDGEEDTSDWSPLRLKIATVLQSHACEISLGALILFNMGLVIKETDLNAKQDPMPASIEAINNCLLAIYSAEICFRLYVLRCRFFRDGWCLLDLLVVGIDWVGILMSLFSADFISLSFLKGLRLARIMRAVKVLRTVPEIQMMIQGMIGATKAICFGVMTVGMLLLIWSILAVQLLNNLNMELAEYYQDAGCDRCARAFSSVWDSMLTFIQHIVAGDSWGNVSLPLAERHPWTLCFFVLVLVSVDLALMNLILAVIVDRAQEARQVDLRQEAREKQQNFKKAAEHIHDLCEQMDTDKSGSLTLAEIMTGFDVNQEFQDTLTVMDITKDDMSTVFSILDNDRSGDVLYAEFVDQLHKMKTSDTHTLLVFIKYYVMEIRERLLAEIQELLPAVENREEAPLQLAMTDAAAAGDVVDDERTPIAELVGTLPPEVARRGTDDVLSRLEAALLACTVAMPQAELTSNSATALPTSTAPAGVTRGTTAGDRSLTSPRVTESNEELARLRKVNEELVLAVAEMKTSLLVPLGFSAIAETDRSGEVTKIPHSIVATYVNRKDVEEAISCI